MQYQENDPNYTVRAIDRACDILDLLIDQPDGMAIKDLADNTNVHRSTIFRYLRTLESRRYVEHDAETGVYRLGLALLPLYAHQADNLVQRTRPHLEWLRDQFDETANLGILDGSKVLHLDIVESRKAMRIASRLGDRDAIHSTALGQAIAASLPLERVTAILDKEGLPAFTDNTITDRSAFKARLQEVRDKGYAFEDGENEAEGRCVAVPLLEGRIHAAVSVAAPAARLPDDRLSSFVAALSDVAERIANEFGTGTKGRSSTQGRGGENGVE